jgi:putative FmdB family regulatory protein
MPTYEYRCTKGHTFEATQSMSDAPLTKCEVCGAPVQRVLFPPAVQFKGSGFYNTDYGTRNRQREKASAESSGADGASKGASDGGDSKPAADKPAAEKPKPAKAAGKTD